MRTKQKGSVAFQSSFHSVSAWLKRSYCTISVRNCKQK